MAKKKNFVICKCGCGKEFYAPKGQKFLNWVHSDNYARQQRQIAEEEQIRLWKFAHEDQTVTQLIKELVFPQLNYDAKLTMSSFWRTLHKNLKRFQDFNDWRKFITYCVESWLLLKREVKSKFATVNTEQESPEWSEIHQKEKELKEKGWV
jgi:hypothetical protein